MNKPLIFSAVLAASGGLISPAAAADPAAGAPPAFTNIAKESGIAAMVAKHQEFMAKYQTEHKAEVKEWWLSGFTLADFDGNGTLDLHLAGHGQQAIAAFNDGTGHFTEVDWKPEIKRGKNVKNDIPFGGGELRLVYDLNEDGKLDQLVSYGDGQGVTYLNDCTPGTPGLGDTPDKPPTWNFKFYDAGFDSFSRAVAFADLNRDGFVDYMITGDEGRAKETHPLHLYLGKGEGKWELSSTDIQVRKESGAIAVDINGDGQIDLLSSERGYGASTRWILINDGDLKFHNGTKDCGLSEEGSIMGVGDLNQDGYPDLICMDKGPSGLAIVLYFNDGKGHFTKGGEFVNLTGQKPSTGNWGGAIVTDFDNDGIADFVVNGRDFLYVMRGLGGAPGGKYEYMTEAWGLPRSFHPNVDEGICFGDINGDGMMDFVSYGPGATEKQHGVGVYRNDLPKKHFVNVQVIGGKGHRAAANSIIRITEPGTGKLLWSEQVCIWARQCFHSYYFAKNTERHFGLGDRATVDVSVEFYPSGGGKKVEKKGVAADSTVVIEEQ